MRKEDLQEILRRIPPGDQTLTVLSLRGGATLTVSAVVRFEPEYLVMRGREGGTTDDGRGFFVPYGEVSFVKLDRMIKSAELRRLYGETVAMDFEENMAADNAAAAAPAQTPSKVETADPGSIAKQNLLARIRATRTAGGSPGSPGP